MENITVIKSIEQYNSYCNELETLTSISNPSIEEADRIELLLLLIENWDEKHSDQLNPDPVDALKYLMELNELNSNQLSKNTGIDKTVISKIINRKKGFSKDVIRILAEYFKVKQELFNNAPGSVSQEKAALKSLNNSLLKAESVDNNSNKLNDSIRIIPSKKTISMSGSIFELVSKTDQDTVLYIPSIKIYGKGKTFDSAKKELETKVNSFLKSLLKLSVDQIAAKLSRLGWKQNKYKSKNFSKSYVDENGILKDFEISVENKIIHKQTELFAV